MRHAMRMFLVPEDVFQSVFVQPQAAAAADGADGTPIGLLRSRIQQIERNRELNEEQKAAQYHQEFKRLNKLVREQEEQPINIEEKNCTTTEEAKTTLHTEGRGIIKSQTCPKTTTKKKQQQQQQTAVEMEKLKKKRVKEMMGNSGTMHNHHRPQRQGVVQQKECSEQGLGEEEEEKRLNKQNTTTR
ncbi:hypothetical protein niasHT_012375 [Heterodera trifolii]|uniref:Uncharacterized protein n=1 Tax=Heterodera trifolii TaxID=157864 RepID=A0ABD2L3X3_9BILA